MVRLRALPYGSCSGCPADSPTTQDLEEMCKYVIVVHRYLRIKKNSDVLPLGSLFTSYGTELIPLFPYLRAGL